MIMKNAAVGKYYTGLLGFFASWKLFAQQQWLSNGLITPAKCFLVIPQFDCCINFQSQNTWTLLNHFPSQQCDCGTFPPWLCFFVPMRYQIILTGIVCVNTNPSRKNEKKGEEPGPRPALWAWYRGDGRYAWPLQVLKRGMEMEKESDQG